MTDSIEDVVALHDALECADLRDHRLGLILSGEITWALSMVRSIQNYARLPRAIWFGNDPDTCATIDSFPHDHARRFLGSEYDLVIIDCTEALNPDVVGITSGLVRGGGVLILIKTSDDAHSRYERRFWRTLRQRGVLDIEAPATALLSQLAKDSIREHVGRRQAPDYRAQTGVIQRIKDLAKESAPDPLVFTADRGRGKTSALGLAARSLIDERGCRILVVAPSRATIKPLLAHGGFDPSKESGTFQFRVPAQLALDYPENVDLCLVDEAAALPVVLLIQLTKRYPRIVFSSTTHGYEGSGQGFAIRFYGFLDQWSPNWSSIHLETPIRWSQGDPVESTIQSALCLDAHLPTLSPQTLSSSPIFRQVDRQTLIQDESELYAVFGLLVGAHYRTVPGDLMRFLDDPQTEIWVLEDHGHIVGALIGSWEGGLDRSLAEDMVAGRRRPHGHFIPGVLSAHLGLVSGAQLHSYRIQRIAIHPARQRQGWGQALIHRIIAHAEAGSADLVGTSFGATHPLVRFWQSCDMEILRLGVQRGRSTGEFSALMALALTDEGKAVKEEAVKRFASTVSGHMTTAWSHLEFDLVSTLAADLSRAGHLPALTPEYIDRVTAFVDGHMELDAARTAIASLIWHRLAQTQNTSEVTPCRELVVSILQGHWFEEDHRDLDGLSEPDLRRLIRRLQIGESVSSMRAPFKD